MHVLATAGHVDHGKSTLVLHLTGTDPDRWAEEKRRGLTIDLGFARLDLPGGGVASVVDVPGHVRFLKNMLAGVGAVDACLFVVAATEGWKPQSEEHLRILELLGVEHGVVALTKVGLVDDDLRDLARLEVEEAVAGSFLAGAPIVATDAPTELGIDDLRQALDRLLRAAPVAADLDRPRLWVDRSFAAAGAGTVVTGTLLTGAVAVDDALVVVPSEAEVRVRSVQSHHHGVDSVGPGTRVALNLSGVAHRDVHRGDVVVRPGQWLRTRVVDASLTVLDRLDHPVSRRGAYVAYLGSGEFPVRVRVLGPESITPGEVGAVRLHLPVALPLLPGDRYVLRDAGRGETVGGGEVLDVDPVLPASRARPDRSVERSVTERGWITVDDLALRTGVTVPATVGRWVVAPAALQEAIDRVAGAARSAGAVGLDLAALDERERSVVPLLEGAVVRAGRVFPRDADDPLAGHPWLAALAASPFVPPPPEGLSRAEVRELVRRGLVVEVDGVAFSATALDDAAQVVARLLRDRPEGVSVGDVRDALATTRKFVLPILGHLDATGRTRRRGDQRVAGPRLPSADAAGPIAGG